MKKIKQVVLDLCSRWYVKYIVTVVLGVAIVGIFDENSILAHLRYKQRISDLKEEIAAYEHLNRHNMEQIRLLQSDPKAIEKIARERYFMKMDDEDIFVLSDDENTSATKNTVYETAD